mmetsp:Transcript_8695/g.17331  ORF Transcript_8695/g.17331 Transcript_8695/m.17331 type:complete len:221 (+) Transcript_8695:142-804(+)
MTRPIFRACSKPASLRSSKHCSVLEGSSVRTKPPLVCGSKRAPQMFFCLAASIPETQGADLSSFPCDRELEMPCSRQYSTPEKSGIDSISSWHRACEASHISRMCPSRPNPVISVHAVMECFWHAVRAFMLLRHIDSITVVYQCPIGSPVSAAARRMPVPRGFVRIMSLPGTIPDFFHMYPSCTCPVMLNPIDISLPSLVCPPISLQSASARASMAPHIM